LVRRRLDVELLDATLLAALADDPQRVPHEERLVQPANLLVHTAEERLVLSGSPRALTQVVPAAGRAPPRPRRPVRSARRRCSRGSSERSRRSRPRPPRARAG